MLATRERCRPLRGDVLQQRAAVGDVHHLQAAADAEHGLGARRECAQQLRLVLVADAVAVPLSSSGSSP